jgi:hypothetical protein
MYPEAYVNPNPMSAQNMGQQPPIDPNALAQAMSFMVTPAGAMSMAAFASHMAGASTATPCAATPYATTPCAQPYPLHNATPAHQYSPPQHSGQKRKWEDRGNKVHKQSQPQLQRKPQGPKPPRAKAAVAPAVPSFGFSLGKAPSVRPVPSKQNGKIHGKKGTGSLGLTHNVLPDSSSEAEDDEDFDEEAALSKTLKGGGYAFEHEGEFISIKTAADVKDWIKQRRDKFPTQEKTWQKAHDAAIQRMKDLEFLRKVSGKPPRAHNVEVRAVRTPTREIQAIPQVDMKKQEELAAVGMKKQEELAALRKRLHESMISKQQSRTAVDLGLGYASEIESDESSIVSDSSVLSTSSEDSSSSSDDDSDAAPEPVSAKVAPPPIKVPRPPPQQRKPDSEKPCAEWKKWGKCGYGHSCRFKHPTRDKPKLPTLYEKMVEQEREEADQMALSAIKFLGQHGFLG